MPDDKAPPPKSQLPEFSLWRSMQALARHALKIQATLLPSISPPLHRLSLVQKALESKEEAEEERNARLDEQWRQMQAETEEERNTRLDARWRWMQEEEAREAAEAAREAAKAAPVQVEPVQEADPAVRKRGGPYIEFPHLKDVLNRDLRNKLVKNPGLRTKEQVGITIKGLRDRGVEVADTQSDTIARRIRAWRKKD